MCPSAMLGISCPGCGGLRAVNDLTNFQLVDAASSNLLFVLALPVILFALVRWVADQWRGTTRVASVNWLAPPGSRAGGVHGAPQPASVRWLAP